jgi:hypothetical protein
MLMAATVLFGVVTLTRIGVSQYPDVDNPNITVSLSWPGASPPAVERQIIEPIEQALSQVEGVQSLASQARAGSARITATFDMSRDVDLALQDIQARVGSAQRSLPKDVPAVTVSKSNPDDQAILQIAVTGPFSKQMLADVARYQVMERLQTAFPDLKFVKAFNSVGAALMVNPQFPGGAKPTMFYCGNDAGAKGIAKQILDDFGWDAADMGTAKAARAIEPLCQLWCIPGFRENAWTHAFALLRP